MPGGNQNQPLRVVMVGVAGLNGGPGTTTLFNKLTDPLFTHSIHSTQGFEPKNHQLLVESQYWSDPDTPEKMSIVVYDTTSQKRFQPIVLKLCASAHLIIYVVDCTSQLTIEAELKSLQGKIQEQNSTPKAPSIVLISKTESAAEQRNIHPEHFPRIRAALGNIPENQLREVSRDNDDSIAAWSQLMAKTLCEYRKQQQVPEAKIPQVPEAKIPQSFPHPEPTTAEGFFQQAAAFLICNDTLCYPAPKGIRDRLSRFRNNSGLLAQPSQTPGQLISPAFHNVLTRESAWYFKRYLQQTIATVLADSALPTQKKLRFANATRDFSRRVSDLTLSMTDIGEYHEFALLILPRSRFYSQLLGGLIGGALGVFLGAMFGALAGPAGACAALIAGQFGAVLGATAGAVAGGLAGAWFGSQLSFWSHPVCDLEQAAKQVEKKLTFEQRQANALKIRPPIGA